MNQGDQREPGIFEPRNNLTMIINGPWNRQKGVKKSKRQEHLNSLEIVLAFAADPVLSFARSRMVPGEHQGQSHKTRL